MRLSGSICLSLYATLSIVACDAGVTPLGNGNSDVGGALSTGASTNNTSSGQGGSSSANATTQQDSPQGGDVSSGGVTQATGGKVSTGGRQSSTTQAAGGAATGGKSATGGSVNGAGGVSSGGGAQTGGAPIGTGGSVTTAPAGGKTSTGGAPPTSGGAQTCVDTPRSSESCADAKNWDFCSKDWFAGYCQATCGKCGSTPGQGGASGQGGANNAGGGPDATGGMNNGTTLPPVTGGQNAWASRYWDCCKPACAWTGNTGDPISACDKNNNNIGVNDAAKNACENGGTAYMCWSGVPRSVSDSVSYGFAAASGGNYKCGQCFQIQFDGNSHNAGANPGAQAIKGKQMIIQVINNGGVESNQFDLLIPGGGVGAMNACSKSKVGNDQWGSNLDLGAEYGGFLSGCNGDTGCVQNKCNTIFAGKTDLLAGCTWFLGWFHAADNPTFQYKTVNCPSDFNSVMGGLNK